MTQRWDDETDDQADVFFATLTLRELRRRQDLCYQQISMASAQRNEDALADLYRMDTALIRAVMTRLP